MKGCDMEIMNLHGLAQIEQNPHQAMVLYVKEYIRFVL